MKKRTYRMNQKMKKMRKKYFGDIASEEYIQTGMPQMIEKRVEDTDDFVKKLLKEDKKAMRKRIREAKKIYKKKYGKDFDEQNVIFV